MNMAQTQLQMARDAGAADYAPVDLGFAQDKFQQAQGAMAERKYADAASLAEESRADAELAQAKARLGAARAQIQSKMQRERPPARSRASSRRPTARSSSPLPAPAPAEPPVGDDAATRVVVAVQPPPDNGFQTVPDTTQQPNQGGQP